MNTRSFSKARLIKDSIAFGGESFMEAIKNQLRRWDFDWGRVQREFIIN